MSKSKVSLKAAMEVLDKEEAECFLKLYINKIKTTRGITEVEAREIALHNIGYYSGYYGDETRIRIEKLFGCQHPIFGKAEIDARLKSIEVKLKMIFSALAVILDDNRETMSVFSKIIDKEIAENWDGDNEKLHEKCKDVWTRW